MRIANGIVVFAVEIADRILKAIAGDEPHRVIRRAIGMLVQPIHGHDAGVFEAARHLGFEQEPGSDGRIACVTRLDLFQYHLAIEFAIDRHGDLPHPAFRQRANDAEPRDFRRLGCWAANALRRIARRCRERATRGLVRHRGIFGLPTTRNGVRVVTRGGGQSLRV